MDKRSKKEWSVVMKVRKKFGVWMKTHQRFCKEFKKKVNLHENLICIELYVDGLGIEKLCILRVDNSKSTFG